MNQIYFKEDLPSLPVFFWESPSVKKFLAEIEGKNEMTRVGISDSGNYEFLSCVHPNMNIYVEGFKSLMVFDKPNFIIIITNPIKQLNNDLSPTQ